MSELSEKTNHDQIGQNAGEEKDPKKTQRDCLTELQRLAESIAESREILRREETRTDCHIAIRKHNLEDFLD